MSEQSLDRKYQNIIFNECDEPCKYNKLVYSI